MSLFIKQVKLLYLSGLIASVLFSCCSGNKVNNKESSKKKHAETKQCFSISTQKDNDIKHLGDSVSFVITELDSFSYDSITIQPRESLSELINLDSNKFQFKIAPVKVGKITYYINIYSSKSETEIYPLNVFVLSDKEPKKLSYKVKRKFWHDPNAYTQGLLFHDGFLYESTGRNGQSSIRKVDPQSGEILEKREIADNYFGEGISLLNDELYMITYTSQVAFVFDINTFEEKRKFNLQTNEGWGLTNNGKELLLSDGSATIYFYEPTYFSLIRQIEVCDNKALNSKLNELEFTPNGLFANVYGQPYILQINPNSGSVLGKLDLLDLFPSDVPRNYDYVLNGIAFNSETNTFYITGKQWPIMYEISISAD